MYRQILLTLTLLFAFCTYGQTATADLAKENAGLKAENTQLKTDNAYLKKVLDINNPIKAVDTKENSIKLTNITANKEEKTVYFTLLIESKNKTQYEFHIDNQIIVDIEGNEIGVNHFKSDSPHAELSANVPRKFKMGFTYEKIENDYPQIIKLLKFRLKYKFEKYSVDRFFDIIEFRDLNVQWK